MTITITRNKLALSVLVAVLIGTGIAGAQTSNDNPFVDVPDVGAADQAFFSEPVEWLWDNNLTTGTSGTTFSPNDVVTRGQYAAFNFRYDQNIVQPAITDLQAEIDANEAAIAALQGTVAALAAETPSVTHLTYSGNNLDSTVTIAFEKVRDLGTITKQDAETDLWVTMGGHSRVNGGFCHWQLRADGAAANGSTSTNAPLAIGANAVQYATGAYFIQGIFDTLDAGDHTLELWVRGTATECENNDDNFVHDIVAVEVTTN